VAQVVQADPPDAGLVAQLAEPLGDLVAVERGSVLVGKHEPAL
jgi:hypothetical protein